LKKRLTVKLRELENAYSTLQDSHGRLIKTERLALAGEMVTKIAS